MDQKEKTSTHICPAWLSFVLDARLRRLVHKPERIVSEYLSPGDTAIDIGAGSGFFTIPMARIAGDTGRVIAVDLQQKMLDKVQRSARRAGLERRIQFHRCLSATIGLEAQADFILAFFMVHETPDPLRLFREVRQMLKENGKFLIVEPPFHVSQKQFTILKSVLAESGLCIIDTPKGKGGRALLVARK